MLRPDVFDYLDHQSFLKDWIQFLKETKKLGLRSIAAAAGISPAAISLCLAGERQWTLKLIGKAIPYLELKKIEQEALRLLYVVGTTEDPVERIAAFDELRRLPPFAIKKRDSAKVYLYLRHWLNVAVRELVSLPDFECKPQWIRDRLRFMPSEVEVERSIKFLIKEGYIQQDANQKWKVTDLKLDCQEGIYRLSLGEYHRQVLSLAQRSIDEVPRDLRLIMGHTQMLSGEQKNKAEEILKNALKEIQKLEANCIEQSSSSEELYQFEFVMIPLSQKGKAA